jgi:hypothetical protein
MVIYIRSALQGTIIIILPAAEASLGRIIREITGVRWDIATVAQRIMAVTLPAAQQELEKETGRR